MGRAGWTATIIGGVVTILVAVLVFMPRSMRSYVKYQARQAQLGYARAMANQQQADRKLKHLISSDEAFLSARPEVQKARQELAQRAALLKKATADAAKLSALVNRDKREDGATAYNLASTINAATRQLSRTTVQVFRPVEEALRYKKSARQLATQAATDAAGAGALPSASTRREIAAVLKRHPTLGDLLAERIRDCQRQGVQIKQTYDQYRLAVGAPGADLVACGKLAEAVHHRTVALRKADRTLRDDIADVDHHVDRILIDIKTSRGLRYHRYKMVRDRHATKTGWQPVNRTLYTGHLGHLGMAIYSKPEGMLGSQATTVAAPPGYAYIDRERYGAWSDPNAPERPAAQPGASTTKRAEVAPAYATSADRMKRVWRFNEAYAYMPALFWGASYKPVTYRDYLSYKVASTMKKPYYGKRSQYGTNGSWTRRHYAGSAYLLLLSSRRHRYGSTYGSRYGSRRSGSRRYGSRFGRSSYGGYGK